VEARDCRADTGRAAAAAVAALFGWGGQAGDRSADDSGALLDLLDLRSSSCRVWGIGVGKVGSEVGGLMLRVQRLGG
jgi:hypothetical protein